jgi:hypothetical protein
MTRTLSLVLALVLLFSFTGLVSFASFGAKPACAQGAQPAPEKTAKPQISFKGGPGDTLETAVIILGAPSSRVGIDAEYVFLEKKFGRANVDWKLKRQSVLHKDGRHYDRMDIELKNGSKKTIFFDITEFFGKL